MLCGIVNKGTWTWDSGLRNNIQSRIKICRISNYFKFWTSKLRAMDYGTEYRINEVVTVYRPFDSLLYIMSKLSVV